MSEPKVYRTDTPAMQFAKMFTNSQGFSWAVTEHGEGSSARYSLVVNETNGHGEMWQMDRSDMSDLWECIGEALHHD